MDRPRSRPLLILDLDETLVWASRDEPDAGYHFRTARYYVTKRPHLEPFLAQAFAWFDVAVWTSSGERYATTVIDRVFHDAPRLVFAWSSRRCTRRFDADTGELYWLKDLKKVKRIGFPLGRTLMIDDSPEKLERNYGNHLCVLPFEGDPADRELLDLLPYLDWIRTQDDFRTIEKRDWRRRKRNR